MRNLLRSFRWPRFFVKEAGISMVEIMVSIGALSFIAVTAARFFSDSAKSQRDIELEQQLNSFHAVLTKVVNDVGNCNATWGMNPGYLTGSVNTTTVKPPNAILTKPPGVDFLGKTASEFTTHGGVYIMKTNWIDDIDKFRRLPTRTWQLTDFQFVTPTISDASTPAERYLVVTYTLNPDIATREIKKRIPVYFRFYPLTHPTKPLQFVECVNPQGSAVNNFQKSVCAGLNTLHVTASSTTSISSEGSMVTFDPNEERCIRERETFTTAAGKTLKPCPAGYVMKGFGSDGMLKCMPVDDGAEDTVPSAAPTTCAAGERMYLEREAGTGKMVLNCRP